MSAHSGPSLGVHLLAGLPSEGVRWGFDRVAGFMSVVPLNVLGHVVVAEANPIGVLLPPFVEPSLIVESWVECGLPPYSLGRPAHIAGVSTFVDVGCVVEHLASAAPLSAHGWGWSDRDRRTVADVAVEQIESATDLVLVGSAPVSDSLARRLDALNPGARRIQLRDGSPLDLTGVAVSLDADGRDARGPGGESAPGRGPERPASRATQARSAAVVPPWMEVLQSQCDPAPGSGLVVYRRALPFDPTRLDRWLADPPRELVRGKGNVWLSSDPDRSFGYSCAGSVHRLFPAGRWWASYGQSAWPSCTAQRRRLLERWHPRFGDRRQDLVFAGVDLDPAALCAGLDACLVAEDALDDSLNASRQSWKPPAPSTRVH